MTKPRRQAALERLESRRREAEQRLSDVRLAISSELGALAPRRAAWAIPLVGFACGIALALATRRKKQLDS